MQLIFFYKIIIIIFYGAGTCLLGQFDGKKIISWELQSFKFLRQKIAREMIF